MAYTRTALGIGMILMATTSVVSAATVQVGDVTAQAGGTAQVAVNLDNPEDDVRALQFSLGPLPAGVELGDVAATGRAVALTADAEAQPDGTVKVVLISLGTETVEAGSGPVLDLYFAADEAGSYELAPSEVHVAGRGAHWRRRVRPGSSMWKRDHQPRLRAAVRWVRCVKVGVRGWR